MKSKLLIAICVSAIGLAATPSVAKISSTLDKVKARGLLKCGVNSGLFGFSAPNNDGEQVGFDVDYCKAIAAAVLGDPGKVTYKLLTAKERFSALQSGEIDVLSRNTTWTMSRDTTQGFNFRTVSYYDGQGFIIRKSFGVSSALQLDGASVCVQAGTTTELNLADYFHANSMKYSLVVFDKVEEVIKAYDSGRCDSYTADASALYSARLLLTVPDDHFVLPEVISKEPLGLVVRQGDDQWLDIVSWVHYALLAGEEFGITQANVQKMRASDNIRIKRLLGMEKGGRLGHDLGLDSDWAVKVISAVGNYEEMFERNLGQGSRLKISRGLNALWSKGGLQYAPPVR